MASDATYLMDVTRVTTATNNVVRYNCIASEFSSACRGDDVTQNVSISQ